MGLRAIPLGTRVFFTHRATSVKAFKKGETWYGGDARDLTSADQHRQYHATPGPYAESWHHPAVGWLAPRRVRRRLSGQVEPRRLDRWVSVWPEQGVGRVIGLTYRQEGRIEYYGGSSYDGTYEGGGNEFVQYESFPLYQVRAHLNGAIWLVPPFACVPLDERVATFGDNIPLVLNEGAGNWFSLEGDGSRPDWDDYVEDVLKALTRERKPVRV